MRRKSEKIFIPFSESPNFFLDPQAYVPGFQSIPSALKVKRNGETDDILWADWPGVVEAEGEMETKVVTLEIRPPNFLFRAVKAAIGVEQGYTVAVKNREEPLQN